MTARERRIQAVAAIRAAAMLDGAELVAIKWEAFRQASDATALLWQVRSQRYVVVWQVRMTPAGTFVANMHHTQMAVRFPCLQATLDGLSQP